MAEDNAAVRLVLRNFCGMGDSQENSRWEEDNLRKWLKEICYPMYGDLQENRPLVLMSQTLN